jgi:hypothetical protein
MSTKKRLLENINKKMDMVNESLPPTIMFTEHETLKMLCELIDYDLGGEEEIPSKLIEIFQDGLKKKGRNFNNNTPEGAYN